MFTGIVEEVGTVSSINSGTIKINCEKVIDSSKIGDSIAVNGVCLTITAIAGNILSFHISDTTNNISRLKHGGIKTGEKVNLERAMSSQGRFGGHIVTGHVDYTARIISINRNGQDHHIEISYPKEYRAMIIPKGSVTVDGISLTIADVMTTSFTVTIIPQTYNETNLHAKSVYSEVHIEVDLFARYINHIIQNGAYNEKI